MQRTQLRLRLARLDAVTQTPDGLIAEYRPGIDWISGLECNRNPKLSFEIREVSLWRCDSNNLSAHAIQHHGAADDRMVPAKLLTPESVAQHDDLILADGLLRR